MLKSLVVIRGKLKTDDMTRHGTMMVAFGILGGLFSYLYQISMGMLLSPEDYGTLFSLISLLIIIGIFSQAIITAMAKFTSKFKAEGGLGQVNYLWQFSLKRTFLLGAAAFAFFASLSPIISRFLNLDNNFYPIILFSSLLLFFVVATNWGTLQGLQRFFSLGSSQVLFNFLRLAFGALLVYLGLSVYGGLAAIPLAGLVVLLLTLFLLRDLPQAGNEKVKVEGLSSYAGLALVAIFSLSVLTNVDVVLAKHYLSAVDAGNYSAISVLGRIAFYAPMGVAVAMFPKTSELFESGGQHHRVFLRALTLTLLMAGVVVIVYWLFPDFIINSLFGGKYPIAIPYLFKYGLAMGFFALSFILMNYFLSLNQTKVAFSLVAAMLLQLGLIILFHDSIARLVDVTLICGIISTVFMLPFYLKVRRSESRGSSESH